jgi:hypothetical protein
VIGTGSSLRESLRRAPAAHLLAASLCAGLSLALAVWRVAQGASTSVYEGEGLLVL